MTYNSSCVKSKETFLSAFWLSSRLDGGRMFPVHLGMVDPVTTTLNHPYFIPQNPSFTILFRNMMTDALDTMRSLSPVYCKNLNAFPEQIPVLSSMFYSYKCTSRATSYCLNRVCSPFLEVSNIILGQLTLILH
jgi:hypothetical protein